MKFEVWVEKKFYHETKLKKSSVKFGKNYQRNGCLKFSKKMLKTQSRHLVWTGSSKQILLKKSD